MTLVSHALGFAMLLAALSAGKVQDIAFMRDGTVWLASIERGEMRAIFETGHDRPLAWSPDGRHLIVWRHSEIGWDLWRVNADGSNAVNLTNTTSGGCRCASYSPDGSRIAFMRDDPNGLWIMNDDGAHMRQLTTRGHRDFAPKWSPGGSRLLYVDLEDGEGDGVAMRIRLFDLKTGEDRALMAGESPAWVSEERIVFAARRGGRTAILTAALDGSEEFRLSALDRDAIEPALSPDRRFVAYLSPSEHTDVAELWTVEVEGGSSRRSRGWFPGNATAPAWSAGGDVVAIAAHGDRTPREGAGLWIINLDGPLTVHLAEGSVEFPAWRPGLPEPE